MAPKKEESRDVRPPLPEASGFFRDALMLTTLRCHARAFFSQRHFVWIAPARGSCKKGEIPEEPGACLWMPGGETLASII